VQFLEARNKAVRCSGRTGGDPFQPLIFPIALVINREDPPGFWPGEASISFDILRAGSPPLARLGVRLNGIVR